jgi:uncharacterized protein (TIGR02118 family)
MIKLVFCLRRRADLSPQEFRSYWLDRHAPLVRRHAAALRIARYVQTHTLASALNDALRESRGASEPFDGVAELWWASEGELREAFASPAGQQAGAELLADEQRFIDLERSALWLAEEHAIVD